MLEPKWPFTILLGLLASVDYSELDRTGMYTVFAPTDDAFACVRSRVEAIDAAPAARLPRRRGHAPHVAAAAGRCTDDDPRGER